MRRIVLGTAGHIDHGKTSLVRALTGVDTDRLKEERERGITIELGFTHLILPDGTEVGFVDVPGHERFVRTMIAGASGIDLVLLVLAADEGVMPQTREHLDICSLLGVKDGLVVLNKIDAVDPEMAALAAEEAAQTVAGTFLEGRPIVPFSAKTGEGKDRLLAAISEAAERIGERSARGPFRMSVDRVFTMKGFGTVVTGTSTGGRVKVGDSLQVHPSEAVGRVRGLQVHGKEATEALAGSRTAINLQGLDRDQVPRGSVLAAPGALVPSQILDLEYRHLPAAPDSFKPKRIRFLVGTQEVVGNLKILDAPAPKPGETHAAQVRLESPIAARAGDRFVLRTYSPMVTVGGGRILDSHARKRRPTDTGAAAHLASLAGDDPATRIETLVRDAGGLGVPMTELALHLPPSESEDAASVTRALAKAGKLEVLDGAVPRALARESFDRLSAALVAAVIAFHAAEPSKPGMPRGVAIGEALRAAKIGGPDAVAIGEAVFRKVEAAKKLVTAGGDVKVPSHVPKLDAATSDLRPVVESTYREGGLMPPTLKEISEKHGPRAKEVQSVIALLHREGVLVKVSQDLYFHREPMGAIQQKLVDYLRERSKITTLEFKDLAGNVTRKFMIPLLEHFDAVRLTMRVGEERVLRKKDG